MPLIKSDLFDVLYRAAGGELPEELELWPDRSTATVVMAAKGYPESYDKGFEISGLEQYNPEAAVVFHAGTSKKQSQYLTTGGRVLAVTGWGNNLKGALDAAYDGVNKIRFKDAYWRRDIGHRAL